MRPVNNIAWWFTGDNNIKAFLSGDRESTVAENLLQHWGEVDGRSFSIETRNERGLITVLAYKTNDNSAADDLNSACAQAGITREIVSYCLINLGSGDTTTLGVAMSKHAVLKDAVNHLNTVRNKLTRRGLPCPDISLVAVTGEQVLGGDVCKTCVVQMFTLDGNQL